MKITQISVFLENRQGRLYDVCSLLGDNDVNIRALTIAETESFGVLRIVVDKSDFAIKLLRENQFVANFTDVVAIEVPDKPGGLAEILEVIEQAAVNVEYVYAFTIKHQGQGLLVFRFNDPDAAIKALQARDVDVLGHDELHRRLTE